MQGKRDSGRDGHASCRQLWSRGLPVQGWVRIFFSLTVAQGVRESGVARCACSCMRPSLKYVVGSAGLQETDR